MPINIYPDRIDFTNYSIRIDSTGISLTPIASSNATAEFLTKNISLSPVPINFPPPSSPPEIGTVSGYTAGGRAPAIGATTINIDRFPFATDTNASDSGDLSIARRYLAGFSSHVTGYSAAGGYSPIGVTNVIDKFPFAYGGNATDVADLTSGGNFQGDNNSTTHGYVVGFNVIDKFPFATDANSTDVANQTQGRYRTAGISSSDFGYQAGGTPPTLNTIDRFPFATDANATDVGDISTGGRYSAIGIASSTDGFITGGSQPTASPSNLTSIERFPFASGGNSVSYGNLLTGRFFAGGTQSPTHGYAIGGVGPGPNTIEKFILTGTFSAANVGNLAQGRYGNNGIQN